MSQARIDATYRVVAPQILEAWFIMAQQQPDGAPVVALPIPEGMLYLSDGPAFCKEIQKLLIVNRAECVNDLAARLESVNAPATLGLVVTGRSYSDVTKLSAHLAELSFA